MTTTAITVQEAEQQLATATATIDQLKAKILDHGPGSVTAEELGQAALDVEHAKLVIQHALKTAEDNAAAERLDHLRLLKAQILDQAGDPSAALDAMRQIEEAAAALIQACTGRQQLISHATAAMRKAGVPRHEPHDKARTTTDAGLGWSDAGMGRGDEIHVDGRRISSINPALLIAAALQRATKQTGRTVNHLAPVIELQSSAQGAAQDPEAWLRARY